MFENMNNIFKRNFRCLKAFHGCPSQLRVFTFLHVPDGKSKDLLTMKQDEEEWIEYQNVMQDVVQRSGLDDNTFYDIRGNHDNFGVPEIGGPFDFFSKYSINAQLKRSGKVNSVTIQVGMSLYL